VDCRFVLTFYDLVKDISILVVDISIFSLDISISVGISAYIRIYQHFR